MNEYSVDFKLKIVKMILNDHISKNPLWGNITSLPKHKDSGYISIKQRALVVY